MHWKRDYIGSFRIEKSSVECWINNAGFSWVGNVIGTVEIGYNDTAYNDTAYNDM